MYVTGISTLLSIAFKHLYVFFRCSVYATLPHCLRVTMPLEFARCNTLLTASSMWLLRCCRSWKCTCYFICQTTYSILAPQPITTLRGKSMECAHYVYCCFTYTIRFIFRRCESFNGMVRRFNVHGNRQSPSRDIANTFATIGNLSRLAMGQVDVDGRYMHCLAICTTANKVGTSP